MSTRTTHQESGVPGSARSGPTAGRRPRPGPAGVLLVAGAGVASSALSYGFSLLTGELAERVTLPVGTAALVVGLALTLWSPRRFGWQWGRTRHELPAVIGSVAAVVLVVGGYRLIVGAAPYPPTFAEVVVVPVGEEALFRGFLLSTLLVVFGRRLGEAWAARWAVAVSAVAFGVGHLGNLGYVTTDFVLVQALAAALFGVLAGWLRLRTRSLVGPVLVHAAMNATAVV